MLSFDITDRTIRIIRGSESNGRIRINSAATLDLEENIIENGQVKDVPRLATLINQVLRTSKMPDKEAIVSISSNFTMFKELLIPKNDKQSEFLKAIRTEMDVEFGIDSSYSVSYIVVGPADEDSEDAGKMKVLATACPFEIVNCIKNVFNMLQISLKSVMVGCNCITKVLLADSKIKSKMPLLAVQIDNTFISLNLYENNQLSFSRFASISAEDYDGSEDYVFEAVNENIFRMLQFQKSRGTGEDIQNIVFYGDTKEFVRLTDSLEKMGLRTSIITVPSQIHGYENLEFASYANAIGAMFKRNKDTERVNLLETDTVNNNKIKSDSSYLFMVLASVLGAALLCFIVWFVLFLQNNKVEKQIQEINDKRGSALYTALNDQITALNDKQTAVKTYLDGVTDAYDAYRTRPYPLSSTYTLIEDKIHDTIVNTDEYKELISADAAVAGKERTEADFSKYYTINSIQYTGGGIWEVDMVATAVDMPFQPLPAILYQAFADMDEVYSIAYTGYSVQEQEQEAAQPAAPEEGAEGQPAAPAQGAVKQIPLQFQIQMKGDKVEIEPVEEEVPEGEAS